MKTLKLSGKILTDYSSNWHKIILLNSDGYKIDLIARFSELELNALDGEIQVNYHISKNELSEIELKENLIKTISGSFDTDYEANGYWYSSWTSGTDYDCSLEINGHDLYAELMNEQGKYVFFEINYKELTVPVD